MKTTRHRMLKAQMLPTVHNFCLQVFMSKTKKATTKKVRQLNRKINQGAPRFRQGAIPFQGRFYGVHVGLFRLGGINAFRLPFGEHTFHSVASLPILYSASVNCQFSHCKFVVKPPLGCKPWPRLEHFVQSYNFCSNMTTRRGIQVIHNFHFPAWGRKLVRIYCCKNQLC